jgi:hypothetical protein
MEPVHFVGAGTGVVVVHGEPPDNIIARLLDSFTGSLVKNEAGTPVLAAVKEGYKFPAMHCKHCRQIILRYRG